MTRKLGKEELEALKSVNAKPTINSGATFSDGDGVITPEFPVGSYCYKGITVEVKSTRNKQFTLSTKILEKMIDDAGFNMPVLLVNYVKTLGVDDRYIVMRVDDFNALINDANEMKRDNWDKMVERDLND